MDLLDFLFGAFIVSKGMNSRKHDRIQKNNVFHENEPLFEDEYTEDYSIDDGLVGTDDYLGDGLDGTGLYCDDGPDDMDFY